MKNSITFNHLVIVSSFLLLILAFNSIGFYHPDEHYYAIDFALLKMGLINKASMSWEYQTQIRPWTLPALYYLIIKLLSSLNVTNPFHIATILRLFSALCSFLASITFVKSCRFLFQTEKSFLFFSYAQFLFWPVLFMQVRTSSDNLSTGLFLAGFSLIIPLLFKNGNPSIPLSHLLFSGLLLALSINIRHQIGLLVAPLFLALIASKKISFKDLALFLISSITMILIGFAIDFWGYHDFTLTPLNYLRQNLLENKISQFGISPWHHYFTLIISKLNPIWGITLLSFYFHFIFKNRKNVLTWITLPFLLFHLAIGHKELRFLYPILPLALLIFSLEWQKIQNLSLKKNLTKLLIFSNLLILPFILFRPAYTPLSFYHFLYNYSKEQSSAPQTLSIFPEIDSVGKRRAPVQLELEFYLPTPRPRLVEVNDNNQVGLYFTTTFDQFQKLSYQKRCQLLFSTYPRLLIEKNFFNWAKRSNIWALHRCS